MNALAVGGIGLYQRYISPYKGFRCANRAVNDGLSCSEFGKRVFSRFPATKAWLLLKRRLQQCKDAFRSIRQSGALSTAISMGAPTALQAEAADKHREQARNTTAKACDVVSNIASCNDLGNAGACACDTLGGLG